MKREMQYRLRPHLAVCIWHLLGLMNQEFFVERGTVLLKGKSIAESDSVIGLDPMHTFSGSELTSFNEIVVANCPTFMLAAFGSVMSESRSACHFQALQDVRATLVIPSSINC